MKKATTRRGFVRNVAVGAGGIVLANSLRETMIPGQSELVAAPAAKTESIISWVGRGLAHMTP